MMDGIADGLGPPFLAAVELIGDAKGRVIVSGMGKSGHIGRKIASTLASTGTPAYYVHPGEASHGDLGMVRPEDAILALSWSGETTELSDLIAYAKRFRVPIVGVTSKRDSTLGRQADICLSLPQAKEACPTIPGVVQQAHWSIDDPSAVEGDEATRLAAFRAARDLLRDHVHMFMLAAGRDDLPHPEPQRVGGQPG